MAVPASSTPIRGGEKVLLLGSCFAESVAPVLSGAGCEVMVNPLGTLYNPASVLLSRRRIESCQAFSADEVYRIGGGDNRYCTFWHHTSRAKSTRKGFLEAANSELERAHEFYESCDVLVFSLGTAWGYTYVGKGEGHGMVVANCLKHPASEFKRELLSLHDVNNCARELLYDKPSRTRAIVTVSPIRHRADGPRGNQLSKSLLQTGLYGALVGDHLQGEGPEDFPPQRVEYFPAYEIMVEELRDYRYYDVDLCHPSPLARQIILGRFIEAYLSPEVREGARKALDESLKPKHTPREGSEDVKSED